jgi:hypothetical protein
MSQISDYVTDGGPVADFSGRVVVSGYQSLGGLLGFIPLPPGAG